MHPNTLLSLVFCVTASTIRPARKNFVDEVEIPSMKRAKTPHMELRTVELNSASELQIREKELAFREQQNHSPG